MWGLMTNLKNLDFCEIEEPVDNFIINGEIVKLLTNLTSLKLGVAPEIPFTSLKHLVHLKELIIPHNPEYPNCQVIFEDIYGENFKVLEYLKELELVQLPLEKFLNPFIIQLTYPHVRFRWVVDNENFIGTYEGSFGEDNCLKCGRGKFDLKYGGHYKGEIKNGKMEGFGILYSSLGRYEGEFRNGAYEGNGNFLFCSGDRYIGEFKNNVFHGRCLFYLKHGETYKGLWENGKRKFGNEIFSEQNSS